MWKLKDCKTFQELLERVVYLENKPDNDNQTLSVSGCDLSISNGNTIPLPGFVNVYTEVITPWLTEEVWLWWQSAVPHDNVENIFNWWPVDPLWLPGHVNWAPDQTNIEPDWIATNWTNAATDQTRYWGWIYIEDNWTLIRDINGNTWEKHRVWVWSCCSSPTVVLLDNTDSSTGSAWANSQQPIVTLDKWWHFIAFDISDLTVQAWVQLQISTNWSTWANFQWLTSTTKPEVECRQEPTCYELQANETYCPPLCNAQWQAIIPLPTSDPVTVTVDSTDDATFWFDAVDIHNNWSTVILNNKILDTWFSRTNNAVSYTGEPEKMDIRISLNAEDTGASNYWSRPKMRILRWGNIIAVFDDLVMQQNGAYDGDATLTWSFIDKQPWANPVYTFEWFDEDARTATLTPNDFSQLSLTATNKVTVLQ